MSREAARSGQRDPAGRRGPGRRRLRKQPAVRVAAGCFAKHAARASSTPGSSGNPAVAAGWTLPGGNLANTRDVASSITSSNVATLGVAWCVPIESTGVAGAAGLANGYSTTPVVVNGVVYLQDLESNVMAIRLATGKVLWTHNYNSLNGGPDGVNVVGGTVYAATDQRRGRPVGGHRHGSCGAGR